MADLRLNKRECVPRCYKALPPEPRSDEPWWWLGLLSPVPAHPLAPGRHIASQRTEA